MENSSLKRFVIFANRPKYKTELSTKSSNTFIDYKL